MRNFILFISLFFSLIGITFAEPIHQIIFFGDSLTDNGNLYRGMLGLAPKSPPYFKGRFSNGPTWSDEVENYYKIHYQVPAKNYAVGGATVMFSNPLELILPLPFHLMKQADKFLFEHMLQDKSHTLFVIWMGANDYLPGLSNLEKATTDIVNETSIVISKLIKNQAKHFLIINLPDLSKTPFGLQSSIQDNLHTATIMHNSKLFLAMDALKKAHPDIDLQYYDVFATFDDILTHLEKYNQKYNKHIKNVTGVCLGENSFNQLTLQDLNFINQELENALNGQVNPNQIKQFTPTFFNSPSIATTYLASKGYIKGSKLCNNPDDYLFWDHVHPSAVTHEMLSKVIIEQIESSKDWIL